MKDPLSRGVAIVGIGCRFPGGANSPAQFWRLLCDGVDAITELPRERFDVDALYDPDPAAPGKVYTRWGGFIEGIGEFDADFFGISPREVRRMDPQQRLLLEVVWEALEDGGQRPDLLAGSNAGVFVGIASHDYADIQDLSHNRQRIDAHVNAGGAACIAANRISYLLDLRGPSLAVDTACSSSLTAVHLACRSMATGECDLAIVAGVNVLLALEPTIGFCRATMLSPDGRCHTFDARANGYVRGEGAGAVALKPLARARADGDPIYAVIRGSAINQDGRTAGISLPSADAQEAMLWQALREAGVGASAIQYIEAHGTGTKAGDPIEAAAIGKVFATGQRAGSHCLIGSVKTNIGHLEAGAGVAGLIKAALALKHRQIPPSLHFAEPNPAIPFEEFRLRVATTLEPWPESTGPAMAGVNSFGFGGANAHAVLEEPPAGEPRADERDSVSAHVLTLSARSPEALRDLAGSYARQLAADPVGSLHDLCYTAAVRRSHHEHRLAVVAGAREEIAAGLEAFRGGEERAGLSVGRCSRSHTPTLAFVFTGMGPQWWKMGRQLMSEEQVFREAVEEVAAALDPLADWSLLDELAAEEGVSRVTEASVAHVANFAIQFGLAALWRSWGINPDFVIGHSSGEMGAACVAGALTLPDAARLAFHRGRLQHRTAGSGRMLAAGVPPDEALHLIAGREERVSIAAFNSPASVTLSGEAEALAEIASALEREQRFCRFLAVDVPYHGPQMDTIRDELLAALGDLHPTAAAIPFISEVTADHLPGTDLDAAYWWRNVREPVRFADMIQRLADHGCELFVEVGPHPVLAASITECFASLGRPVTVLPSLRRGQDERSTMLGSLAALHVRGRTPDWRAVYPTGVCVSAPTYPWQRERHWFESAPSAEATSMTPAGKPGPHPLLSRRLRSPKPVWETELQDSRLAFLEDHLMQDSAVFPAAGYVEMVLAAAHQLQGRLPVSAEQFAFRRFLFLASRDTTLLQLLCHPQPQTVEIYANAQPGEPTWTLHATAVMSSSPLEPAGETIDLGAIRDRCAPQPDVAGVYRSFERRGLRYGQAFRGIRQLWLRGGEALAQISLEGSESARAETYFVHPALLDAAFQVLLVGADAEDVALPEGLLNLVTSIGRIDCFGRAGAACWARAVVTRHDEAGFEGDVELTDDAGRVLVRCRDLRLRALASARQRPGIEDCLYQEFWKELPLATSNASRPLPSPGAIAAAAEEAAKPGGLVDSLPKLYAAAEPALHRFTLYQIHKALSSLGWSSQSEDGDPETLADVLGIVPRHRRFFGRLLELAREDSSRRENQDPATSDRQDADSHRVFAAARAAYPEHDTEFVLVERCGKGLAGILRGEVDPRELLFSDSFDALSWMYRTSPMARRCNQLAAMAVAMATGPAEPSADPLRILEIGAGTGGLTSAVLPALGAAPIDYFFTDVSTYFLKRAGEEFKGQPGMRFGVLDIESDLAAQQVAPGSFDVLLGANVVHATADLRQTMTRLRSLLAPGGLLVLVELTRRAAWLDIIFGPLEGWWRFADHDLRPGHPLLLQEQWLQLLQEVGFEKPEILADPGRDGGMLQTVFAARASHLPTSAAPRRRWLLFSDRQGAGARIAATIRDRGDTCICASLGRTFARQSQGDYEVRPTRDDTAHLLAELEAGGSLTDIVHLASLDAQLAESATANEILDAQRFGCGSALHLVQALEDRGPSTPGLWLVTAGSQTVEGEAVPGLAQAPLWGFGRVLRNERPELHPRLVDLSPEPGAEEIEALVAELSGGCAEEVALRGRKRWVRQLRARPPGVPQEEARSVPVPTEATAFRLEIGHPGAIETLVLREQPRPTPGPDQVVIRVLAAGLNFRDVMLALGMLPAAVAAGEAKAGIECAGIVHSCGERVQKFRPGDEVVAVASGALGSYATASQELVLLKPRSLSFEEGATIPSAYLTARYGLVELARMRAGERVLIHAASGGVGHAALALCQQAGVEIFATAGSEEKREYLRSLDIEHVMDSRSLAWAGETLERTGGQGVDIVLNSLAGDAIAKGLEVLRPFGRFVEIGKRDIYADASLGLLPFAKNIAFYSLDLIRLCHERPTLAGELLQELLGQIADGKLTLPPHRDFDVAHAVEAYRLMARAQHIGKVVLTVREPTYTVRAASDRPLFRPDATYLITGGLGGLGLAMAEWMASQGARHLVLLSRSAVAKEHEEMLHRLEEAAENLRIVYGDVAQEEEVARTLSEIRGDMPPLRGVFHLAMVLDDAMIGQLDEQRFLTVLRPKIGGAWNLHRLTEHLTLDHFVLFSSVSALLGTPGQGNYAAANSFLDGLAAFRKARGLPAVTIAWGPVSDVGYLSRHQRLEAVLNRLGLAGLTPAEMIEVLEQALRDGTPHLIAARLEPELLQKYGLAHMADVDHEQDAEGEDEPTGAAGEPAGTLAQLQHAAPVARRPLLETHLLRRISKVLGTASQRVDPERPLTEMGLDSLLAVELLTALKLEFGVQIPVVKLLQGISARALVDLILLELGLDAALEEPRAAAPAVPDPDAGAELSTNPLSFEQRRFWFLEQLAPGDPSLHASMAARLYGSLDTTALARSVEEIVRRHEMLRTGFRHNGGDPQQVVTPPMPLVLPTEDLRHLPASSRESELQRLATAEIRKPFDLARPPLLRGLLIRLDEAEHALLLVMHHICMDSWSMTLLAREAMTLYTAFVGGMPSPLPATSTSYADYVRRQREGLPEEAAAAHLEYWKRQLAGAPAVLPLPTDRPRTPARSYRGGHVPFELSAELTTALFDLSRREGVTLFMTLLAAFQTLLYRCSGESDVSVGTPVVTRNGPEAEELVGCCMNTLVLRSNLSGDPPFTELLQRVRETTLGALSHQDLPFEQVVEAVRPKREVDRSPLFQAMLVLHNVRWPEMHMAGLDVQPLDVEPGSAACDLGLLVDPGEQLHGTLEYDADLFEPATAARITEQFEVLLEGIVRDPGHRISTLPWFKAAEQSQILTEWSRTASERRPEVCLHEFFAAQAQRTPEAVAVVCGREQLSYGELDRRADRLARYLRRLGVGPEVIVGLHATPSPEMLVGLIAILKAGGAYLPLDPATPRERLRFMLRDSKAPVLLTLRRLAGGLPEFEGRVVPMDEGVGDPPSQQQGSARRVTPDDLAYVMYTSGSTGAPKGVMITHRAIGNQVLWRQSAFPLDHTDVVLQRTPIGFDPSVWELLGPLSAGARLAIPTPDEQASARWVDLIAGYQATVVQVVPSLLSALLEDPGVEDCRRLQHVFCGGEPLEPELRSRFFDRLPGVRLHNLYGPTEAAIDATCWTCDEERDPAIVPIGRPITNVSVYLLDCHRQPVPIGVPGELYLGGVALARGYLNQPELTAERFVPNPFDTGTSERLYRTGDLARWLSDGVVEFLGRRDEQVKIRGSRIELGEVTALLLGYPGVGDAATVIREDVPGEPLLAAHIVTEPGREVDLEGLRAYLGDRLPAYMMPARCAISDALPRLPNGKIDRRALATGEPLSSAEGRTYLAPRDLTELRLSQIWEELLEQRPVGVTDDFFDLGGHSLLAVRLLARIRQAFKQELPLASFVRMRTIERLACLLRQSTDDAPTSPIVALQPRGSELPFYCVHPSGGSALCYVPLARSLGGNRPVYGIHSPALDGQAVLSTRIEDMAADYLKGMRAVQSEGPYLVGGWSMGAFVAHEMACQLHEHGDEVALLVLFDPPPLAFPRENGADLAAGLSRFAESVGLGQDGLTTAFAALGPAPSDEQLAALLDQARRARATPEDMDVSQLRRRLAVHMVHLEAMKNYRPRPFAGQTVLFRPSDSVNATVAEGDWEQIAAGGITRYTTPGDHYSMLQEPVVQVLGRELGRLLGPIAAGSSGTVVTEGISADLSGA